MFAIDLKTEYMINPTGIDIRRPRLYWNCSGGFRQTAWQVLASTENGTSVWDSGKVASNRMTHIPYEGPPIKSCDIIIWKVRLWDEHDQPG